MIVWLSALGFFGTVVFISGVASYIHKKSNSQMHNVEEGIKNSSNSQQIYTESSLQNAKNNDFTNFGGGS